MSGTGSRPPTLDNVARLEAADPVIVEREHLSVGRPVVVAGLWDGGPIDELRSPAGAARIVGDAELAVQRNYLEAIIDGGSRAEPRTTTLAAFLRQLDTSPGDEVCIEYPTPAPLLERIPWPAGWELGHDPDDAVSHTFVAAAGNYTHLHYDDDQRNVLLHQVFGAKRVSVIHPRETHKLDPMAEPGVQRCSGVLLHEMDDEDKLAFLRYANAWDCVVEQGETLVIPAMAWHYVDYVDTSLSVSWRLPRSPCRRRLGDLLGNPGTHVQRVVAGLAEGELDEATGEQVLAAVDAVGPDPTAMAATAESICRRIWSAVYRGEMRYSLREAIRPRPVPQSAPEPGPGSVVRLRRGVEVARTIGPTEAVLVSAEGGLVARLERDWIATAVELVASRTDGVDVADLAARTGASGSDVAGLVAMLAGRGLVVVEPAGRPARRAAETMSPQ